MDNFAKMDIFFLVTTTAVVVLTILVGLILSYLLGITKDIKDITSAAKKEAELLSEDLSDLRENIQREGAKLKFFSKFFQGLGRKSTKRKNYYK